MKWSKNKFISYDMQLIGKCLFYVKLVVALVLRTSNKKTSRVVKESGGGL